MYRPPMMCAKPVIPFWLLTINRTIFACWRISSSKKNYNVRVAGSGARALSTIEVEPPDLILLDIKMPEMDGFAVCEQLKQSEQTKRIPIIFISALNEAAEIAKTFKAGGVDFITKPFQAEEVLTRVNTHLTLVKLQKTVTDLTEQNALLKKELQERKHKK